MHDMSDADRKAVFGEAILDELKAINEYVRIIPEMNKKLDKMDERITSVEETTSVIKPIVKENVRLLTL
jgi:prefoldin subunit 5